MTTHPTDHPSVPDQVPSEDKGLVEGAYDTISLFEYFGIASILLFLAAVASRQIVNLLPYRMQGYTMMPPLAVILVPCFSSCGLLLAFLGRKRGSAARFGLVANGIVFALSMLLVLAAWWWRRSYS
jgi:hypothetical protein